MVFLIIPGFSLATHIVGGVLNYTYIGNNKYTIKLKLYRDCGSSAAAFPSNVTIKIKGNNGANFSPSKDLTISLGNVTTLSANLLPCAVAPNPIPCVQEGVYTQTITLPPNTGGYHLYYQVSARNLSLTNINGACNCIGESFYAYIPNNTVSSNSNSNAVFTAFPPLFICANEPFTFNHSATDADGDSLVYSLYTPYEDNTTPTYSNNVAIFPEVIYLSGYTTNNPLGATPFNLNPITGVLTGTPNTIGQFVVGVRVKEYRNGVYISQTLRDFQFNVLNCPEPPPTLAIANMTLNNGCSVKINATGITAASSTWKSIYPGAIGAYNNFMSCTSNCLNPTITAIGSPPPYVDYVVCGIATNCLGNNTCDTFRVHFNPPLSVSVAPGNPALCNGQTSTTLIAIGSGGTPPYNFLWNNVNPTQTISVGAGTYNIKLTDGSGCPPAYSSAVVTSYSVPVAVNAGPDKTVCVTNPITSLNATVTGATGGLWSGGTGTFSPNNASTSNLFYTPTATELTAGSTTLYLTTTGSGACPPATDTVVLTYSSFTGTTTISPTNVSCYGGNNGSALASVVGGASPHTFIWNTIPTQSIATANNLALGNYSVTITDAIGCQLQKTVAISQPLPISISSSVTNVSCFGGSNGSLSVTAIGGVIPYTYSWSPGNQTASSISSLAVGTYSLKITDSKSCSLSTTFSITQPSSLTIAFTQTQVSCFGGSDGKISSVIGGGTSPYTYSWIPVGASTTSLTNLQAGTYSLIVKDFFNCTSTKSAVITQPVALALAVSVTNETCNYLNNGSANATVSGGTAGYSYTWQPGSLSTNSISNLASGNYSLYISDLKGCTNSTIVTITEPSTLAINFINISNVSCFGGNNGSIIANISGGTSGYTYSWSPGGASTSSLSNLIAGNYTLSVLDNKSCSATAVAIITEPSALLISAAISSVSCFGGNDGTAALTASGGTSPYSYFWLPSGQITASVSALSARTYTSLVTDVKGCTVSTVHSVTQSSSITIAFTQTAVSCFGGSDARINSSVSGGNSPYSFNWTPGTITTQNIQNLNAGTYTLQIKDLFNCAVSKTVSISQPSVLLVAASATNETCDYLNNGLTSAQASGGNGSYTYLWLPGSISSKTLSNLASGNYSVTVTDLKGCTVNTVVTINQPATLNASITSVTHVNCFGGNNGSAIALGTGGTANYTYTWNPGNIISSQLTNVSQGVYSVSVSDTKSCIVQTTVNITQPASITVTGSVNTVSCYSGNNGVITLSLTGGTSPYTYFWLPIGQTTSVITNLAAGNYSVNLSDANGCLGYANYSVSQSPSIAIAFTSTQVSCFNGSNGKINSIVSGGVAPYTYNWSYGSITTQTINGLPIGTYTLTVIDSQNCVASKTVSLSQPSPVVISTSVTNETCNYLNNGAANALASGGTPGYTYLWQPGAIASASIANLASGTYSVIATDVLGCTSNATITITEPAAVAISFTNVVDVSCNGGNDGTATALGSGGTPNYSYTWTTGSVVGNMIGGLSLGVYSVSISDNNGCTTQNTVNISEPAPLVLIPSVSNVVCANGSNGAISISMNGGVAPYTHNLMPGNIVGANFASLLPGTYSIITQDANSCNNTTTISINQPIDISTSTSYTDASCSTQNGVASISVTSGGNPPFTYNWLPSGGTNSVSTNLFAGSYSVQVTDGLGCVSTKIVNINNVNAPVASIDSYTNVTCNGGSNGALTASYTGGTGACTYSWSPNGGTGLTASNLSSGVYVIQITDNVGCIGLATSSMVAEPPPVVVSVFPSNVSCFGGSSGGASASVSGGTPAYSYNWLPGSSTNTILSGVSANSYTLEITDANNCLQTATFTISQPTAALNVSAVSSSVSCFGGANGSLTSTSTGGTAPYNYIILPGNFGGQTISNLSAGNYTITASDLKSCVAATTITIIEPTAVALVTGAVNSNCSLANGQVSVVATGGTGSYTYQWSPTGGTSAIANNLASGNYTITVTDSNNCTASTSQTLVNNPEPLVTVSSVTNVSCYNGSDGAATTSLTGGVGPFTYSWIPIGGSASTASNLTFGTYSVEVTSANGCTVMASSPIITQPSQIFISLNTLAVSCYGGSNGGASATVFGGTPGYTYSWQASASTATNVTGLSFGNYTMQVSDFNNCVQTKSFAITQPTAAISVSMSALPVSCFGGNNGSASVTGFGGTFPYNYTWAPGNINGSAISNLFAGSYTVNATDINGCSTSSLIAVNEPTPIQITFNEINSNCSFANGQLSANVNGGTGSYSYLWAPSGGTANSATNLLAGMYTLTVIDSNTCTAISSETVIDNPAPLVTISTVTNVSCYSGSDGAAMSLVSGGTGPYTYSWLPSGGMNPNANGLSTGNYSVAVVSANGCSVTSTSSLINEPTQISTNITTSSVSCFGNSNGTASLMTGGGTPGYTYFWPSGTSANSALSGLNAGTYTINVYDLNNCQQTVTFSIAQPTAALDVSILSTHTISCYSGNNGSVSVNVSGGTTSYSYNWFPNGGNAASAASLIAGSYSVSIYDANGCNTFTTVNLQEPILPLSSNSSATAVSCYGGANGSATVFPVGGTPGYSYQWSPGNTTSQSENGLSFGTYTVTVTDLNQCQTSRTLFINQPANITGSIMATNSSCDLPNGSLSPQISGGTAPYTYSWQPGSFSTSNINALSPGGYTLQVIDRANCTALFTASLINIPGPSLLIPSSKNVSCFGGNNGSATLTINQGTPPFAISWLPFGGSNTVGTSLLAGTYSAHVTDGLGCKAVKIIDITEPNILNASITDIKNVSCFGGTNGSISVVASGGTPNYSFSWTPTQTGNSIGNLTSGEYTLNLKDANNCSLSISAFVAQPTVLSLSITGISDAPCHSGTGSASVTASGGKAPYAYSWNSTPIQNGNILSSVVSGNYTVFIKDANDCTNNSTVTIKQPSQVSTSVTKKDTICFGKTGVLQASANGGSGNYHYTWLPGAITNSGTLTFTAATSVIYTVLAFDQNGCSGKDANSTIVVYNLTPNNLHIEGLDLVCPGKSSVLEAVVNGINGPLTYQWNNNLPPIAGVHVVTPAQATSYIVNVSNSCGTTISDTILVKINPLPIVDLTSDTLFICNPGTVNFTDKSQPINSADPLISWNWLFGDGTSSGEQNPSHTFTTSGTHTVNLEVTTDRGCVSTSSVSPIIIEVYPKPKAAFSVNSNSLNLPYELLKCTNQSTGAVSYNWNFGVDGKSTLSDPQFLMQTLGDNKIQLVATSQYGCSDTTYKNVITNADIVFPNAFTPNEEHSSGGYYTVSNLNNDVFFPYTSGVVEYRLQIFNRWGELIFESNDVKYGWDGYYRGKICQIGVYVWKAEVKLNNGKEFSHTGNLSLLR